LSLGADSSYSSRGISAQADYIYGVLRGRNGPFYRALRAEVEAAVAQHIGVRDVFRWEAYSGVGFTYAIRVSYLYFSHIGA
jgi:hypothetical protein